MANLDDLYMPFNSNSAEIKTDDQSLSKEDQPIQTFRNKGNVMITILLMTLAVMIAITIYLGFFYELAYNRDKIPKTEDLAPGETIEGKANTLKQKIAKDLEIAGYVLGALGIVVAFTIFGGIFYWRKIADPELTRENIIGRDISYSMNTGNAIDNVSKLLAYHVHPDKATAGDNGPRKGLQKSLGKNLRGAMQKELLFPRQTVRRMYNPVA